MNPFANNESIRLTVKDETEKILQQMLSSRDKYLNDQIKRIYNNVENVQRLCLTTMEERIREVKAECLGSQKEHENTMNVGLKKVVDIINRRINDLDKQFVPITFVDDMEKEIEGIH